MMTVAVVGYGYWGPNLVRNFVDHPQARVKYVCDVQPDIRAKAAGRYPAVRVVDTLRPILEDPDVAAMVIATPVSSHERLVRECLDRGKHVLVEKPLALRASEAERLVALAAAANRVLMVDHTFVYTAAVRKIKELLTAGELGDILYFDSIRVNLGLLQHDINVIMDLAPHDLSILDYLFDGQMPQRVTATGTCHLGNGLENVAFITMEYASGMVVHLNVNWLSPVKVRQILIGGSKRMVVYDDIEPTEKVKVYDRGVTLTPGNPTDVHRVRVAYRVGDIWSPHLDQREALSVLVDHFLASIQEQSAPITDGRSGVRVVRILEAIQQSVQDHGRHVTPVTPPPRPRRRKPAGEPLGAR